MRPDALSTLARDGVALLREQDPDLYRMLVAEHRRQAETLVLVASSSIADPSVLACQASTAVNVTAEGYPGRRYHGGCAHVDEIEELATARACRLFGAEYANVQPHSASVANGLVLTALLRPGDTILGMDLHQGGHLTHGAPVSMSGRLFRAHGYGLDGSGLIDYVQVDRMARRIRPKMIICGATAYSRVVDFARFRAIADGVGALLLADISHVAGLVVAGLHPNPVPHAHVTTTCTHKQLFGPRGGLILLGPDAHRPAPGTTAALSRSIGRAVFPFFQGAPAVNAIAAKARALGWCGTAEFAELAGRIVGNARALAAGLQRRGYHVASGGTDNHIVLLDLTGSGLTGLIAERALESAGIIVNKNHVPGDRRPPTITSGLRIGTNTVSRRGARPDEMDRCAELIDQVLRSVDPVGEQRYTLDEGARAEVVKKVGELARRWPIPQYPAPERPVS